MGVDYTAQLIYGIVLTDADMEALKRWWNEQPGNDVHVFYDSEALDNFVGTFRKNTTYPYNNPLTYAETGSRAYGGEGQLAIGIARLSRSIDYRDTFTEFYGVDEYAATGEEIAALDSAMMILRGGVGFAPTLLAGMTIW